MKRDALTVGMTVALAPRDDVTYGMPAVVLDVRPWGPRRRPLAVAATGAPWVPEAHGLPDGSVVTVDARPDPSGALVLVRQGAEVRAVPLTRVLAPWAEYAAGEDARRARARLGRVETALRHAWAAGQEPVPAWRVRAYLDPESTAQRLAADLRGLAANGRASCTWDRSTWLYAPNPLPPTGRRRTTEETP